MTKCQNVFLPKKIQKEKVQGIVLFYLLMTLIIEAFFHHLRIKLASQIETGKEPIPLYIDVNPHQEKESSSEQHGGRERRSAQAAACGLSMAEKIVAEKTVLKPGFEKLERVPAYSETVKSLKIARRKEAEKTKGDKWFNLPAPEMTEEKQRDLEIIQMRSILNPKQFYKKNDLKVLPKYFQVIKCLGPVFN